MAVVMPKRRTRSLSKKKIDHNAGEYGEDIPMSSEVNVALAIPKKDALPSHKIRKENKEVNGDKDEEDKDEGVGDEDEDPFISTMKKAAMTPKRRTRSLSKKKIDLIERDEEPKKRTKSVGEKFDAKVEEEKDEEERDDFMAEDLPSYAKTYILPRRMRRKSEKDKMPDRRESVVNPEFQMSMLKVKE